MHWQRHRQQFIRFGVGTASTALLVHFALVVSGNGHVYRALQKTVFQGRLGPDILEYLGDPQREVAAGHAQPWPISARFNLRRLTDAELAYHRQFESVAFAVIHRDSLMFEQYWDGFDATMRSNSFSMSKSVVAAALGAALAEGKISNVDEPLHHYLPQYNHGQAAHITLRHLLTMSSGIDFGENYINPFGFVAKANYGDNLEVHMLNRWPLEQPGTTFTYQSGNTQLLAMAVEAATRTPIATYVSNKIWQPLGAEHSATWSLDSENGMEKAFCCLNATALDFARLAKLYADGGRWRGVQLIPSYYVDQALKPTLVKDAEGTPCLHYGFQWWLGEHRSSPFFMMRGKSGQYVICLPQQDLILVRLGRHRDRSDTTANHPMDVYRYLDMALRIIEP